LLIQAAMNASIPSLKAPVSNDPQSGAPPVDPEKNSGGQDFAGALAAAAAKPSRKSVPNKAVAADSGGGTLPVSGNPSPPAASAPPSTIAPPATALLLLISVPSVAAPAAPAASAATTAAGAAGLIQQAAGATPQSAGQAAQAPSLTATAAATAATIPVPAPADTTEQGGAAATTLAAAHTADPAADAAMTAMTKAAAGAAGNSRVPPGTAVTGAAAGRLQASKSPDPASGSANRSVAAGTDDDSATDGVSGIGTFSAVALDMALAEGGDATGAAATAVQANVSPTIAAFTPAQSPLVQNIAAISGSPSAIPQIPTATVAVADASALSNLGDADKHAHGGGGDAALGGSAGGGDGTAAAQQLSSNTSSTGSTDASSTPSFRLNAGVDSPEFPQGLADRVSFMIDSNLNGAKLQVNPPQLGPIELQIAVQGGHAQVSMSTHSAVTREALESSLPKLREMLGAQGFGQVSVDISQRSFQERSANPQPYEWTPPAERAAVSAPLPAPTSRSSQSALDTYA
jgi:flagellar hook-length control protein FliK